MASYPLVSVVAVTVMARAVISPVVSLDEGDGVVGATVAVADRSGRGQRLGGADVGGVEGLGEVAVSVPASVPAVMVGTAAEAVVAS